ncbi:MAG: rod shape-determining protein MreC [bacterium]
MASFFPPTQAAGSRGARLWWASYVPVAIVLLALLALGALGQFLGWGTAITSLFLASSAQTVANPPLKVAETLPSKDELLAERQKLLLEVAQLQEQATVLQQASELGAQLPPDVASLDLRPARIIYKDPYRVLPSFICDLGSADGVTDGMVVLGQASVIGRVNKTWPHRSRIDLLTSPGVAFGALVQSSRALGIVEAEGDQILFRHAAKTSPINSGDRIVTSGVPGLTPAGIPIGLAAEVIRAQEELTLTVVVDPIENPWILEIAQLVFPTDEPLEEDHPSSTQGRSRGDS